MAIGTTAAILGSAALGTAGSLFAGSQASKAQSKSAAAGQAATDQASAEARRQYDLSRSDNQPWLQAGQGALGQLSRLYGLNTQAPTQAAMSQPYPTGQAGGQVSYGGTAPAYSGRQGGTYAQMMSMIDSGELMGDGPAMSTGQYGQPQQVPAMQTTATPQQQPQAQPQAQGGQFDTFWQSPDYNFRQNEQARALTARNAMLGIQDSGAAQRSAMQLSGNMASAEYNNYANRLATLAGVGQTAAGQNQDLGQSYAGAVGNLVTNNAKNLASSYQSKAAINGLMGQQLTGVASGLLMNKGLFGT